MNRLILSIAIAALFAGISILQARDSAAAPSKKGEKSVRLTDADNKKTVQLPVGTSFDVALKGNATTGYQWQLDKIEGGGVRQAGKIDYVPDKHPERMVGFGGTFIFHFDVVKATKTKIRLVYVRPWEKDKPPEKTFEVTIDSSAAAEMLVFEGTVIAIENSPLPKSTQNYLVTMQVNHVLKGQFKGMTFQFRVHSPTKSGLKLKETYTVEAKRFNGKYTVDQYQWTNARSNKDAARLGRDEVIAIAKAKAVENGIDLSRYDLKRLDCTFAERERTWTVLFSRQPPTPGGHFMVLVDDRTKAATLTRGK
jgi:predicted secreted protein